MVTKQYSRLWNRTGITPAQIIICNIRHIKNTHGNNRIQKSGIHPPHTAKRREFASWPVSRVLYGPGPKAGTWQPFIWDNACALPRATHPDDWPGKGRNACANHVIPIRFCSRWGLPCHPCCHARGGLLPHPFTLTCQGRRYSLCGTFPGVTSAGRYPAPFFRGARTFLPRNLSVLAERGCPANWPAVHSRGVRQLPAAKAKSR